MLYVAAALDEIGAGHITGVDLERAREWFKDPSIDNLLERTGLGRYVTVYRERLSYTWFLRGKIEEQTKRHRCEPFYDFCYIDGPKNWTIDGCAFFLVDKLLKKNGYILFDDLKWRYATASEYAVEKLEECGIQVSEMDAEERNTPHVSLIFKLLVMQHPDYSGFALDGDWAWAEKTGRSSKTNVGRQVFFINNSLKRRAQQFARRLGTCI
jgi:hypothetical protein